MCAWEWECECVWYIYLAFKHLALLSFVAILEAMGTYNIKIARSEVAREIGSS